MIRLLTLLTFSSVCSFAASTTSWEMNTFADFLRGRFEGVSLSRDGRMTLAPKSDVLLSSEQPSIWDVVKASDGSVFAGTGHRGRLYRVTSDGKSEVVWTAPQPEIFSLASGPDGAIYAGTSPQGRVYRIQGKEATEYFNPQSNYIWSLAFGPDGALYVGTGDKGKIYRVTAAGTGEEYYDTGQSHVTTLAFDGRGSLLAGSEPNGILYRISAKDKAFVVYDSNLPEIRTVTVGEDGVIYAAALGGSVGQRTEAAATAANPNTGATAVTAPTTTITITDESNAQVSPNLNPNASSAQATSTILPGTTVYSAAPTEMAGVDKSAVYRINPDGTVETVWTSKEENVYDLLLSGKDVMFSTDSEGRIYVVQPDRRVTLLLQTNDGETTRLLPDGEKLIAATATGGKLYAIGGGFGHQGQYVSPVHDAGSVSKWGQLSWRGERKGAGGLLFRTRAGNSARPDKTWSDWSEPIAEPKGANISSPNARFLQWRAEFSSGRNGSDSPSLTGVTVAYLPQNNPPMVQAINVTTQLAPVSTGKSASAPAASSGTYSITVTDTGDTGASTLSGTNTQMVSRGVAQQIVLSWASEDPDGDKLLHTIYFRGEEETQWKLLRANLAETTLTLEGDVLADGKYLFRVIASDKSANSPASARTGELISAPVLFDNTPPQLRATAVPEGNSHRIDIVATDATSALRRAEYSLDAAPWVPIEADDGVTDGTEERFTVRLENLPAGEHLVVFRAYDASNNPGLTKVVITSGN
jgi:sugar lactone lactonase YvrE